MTIKLIPLTKVYPGAGYDANRQRCFMFAHAGIDYLRASDAVIAQFKIDACGMHVILPLLHMSLELLVKAHAARFDDAFNPKGHGHQVAVILKKYAGKIESFRKILMDPSQMELVAALEKSWELVRYGESYIGFDGKDLECAQSIIVELVNDLHRVTGTPFLPHHYSKSRGVTVAVNDKAEK